MKTIILILSVFFFQSIANANLLKDCQNITNKSLSELNELCPIGNKKEECSCDIQFSNNNDSIEAKLIKNPVFHPEIKVEIECDGKDKFCEFTDEEGNELCDGKLVETPDGIYVGDYDKKGRAHGEGIFINENVIYLGEFSKNRMHNNGTLINNNKLILFEGKHKYGRMNNYNINYNILDLDNIKNLITHKNYDNKIRISNTIKMNTGHNYNLEINGKNTWYPMKINQNNKNIICKFENEVISQIEGGEDGGSDSGGGDGGC